MDGWMDGWMRVMRDRNVTIAPSNCEIGMSRLFVRDIEEEAEAEAEAEAEGAGCNVWCGLAVKSEDQ